MCTSLAICPICYHSKLRFSTTVHSCGLFSKHIIAAPTLEMVDILGAQAILAMLSRMLEDVAVAPSYEKATRLRSWYKDQKPALNDTIDQYLQGMIVAHTPVMISGRLPKLHGGQAVEVAPGHVEHRHILLLDGVRRAGLVPYAYRLVDGIATMFLMLGTKHPYKDEPHIHRRTDFGGGCHVYRKESLAACVLRELAEETGNRLLVPHLKQSTIFLLGPEYGSELPQAVLLYPYVDDGTFTFTPNQEIATLGWYSVADVYAAEAEGIVNDTGLSYFLHTVTPDRVVHLAHPLTPASIPLVVPRVITLAKQRVISPTARPIWRLSALPLPVEVGSPTSPPPTSPPPTSPPPVPPPITVTIASKETKLLLGKKLQPLAVNMAVVVRPTHPEFVQLFKSSGVQRVGAIPYIVTAKDGPRLLLNTKIVKSQVYRADLGGPCKNKPKPEPIYTCHLRTFVNEANNQVTMPQDYTKYTVYLLAHPDRAAIQVMILYPLEVVSLNKMLGSAPTIAWYDVDDIYTVRSDGVVNEDGLANFTRLVSKDTLRGHLLNQTVSG